MLKMGLELGLLLLLVSLLGVIGADGSNDQGSKRGWFLYGLLDVYLLLNECHIEVKPTRR
jgi:hypothetical protein